MKTAFPNRIFLKKVLKIVKIHGLRKLKTVKTVKIAIFREIIRLKTAIFAKIRKTNTFQTRKTTMSPIQDKKNTTDLTNIASSRRTICDIDIQFFRILRENVCSNLSALTLWIREIRWLWRNVCTVKIPDKRTEGSDARS